jgi:hypothetical protein
MQPTACLPENFPKTAYVRSALPPGLDAHDNLPQPNEGPGGEDVDPGIRRFDHRPQTKGPARRNIGDLGVGEFGRTNYCQGKLTADNYGRDHHPRCFSIWMAGGGVKPGVVHGETDEFGYNIIRTPFTYTISRLQRYTCLTQPRAADLPFTGPPVFALLMCWHCGQEYYGLKVIAPANA